jgi:hypothetical protein
MISESTFAATGACGPEAGMGFIARVGSAECTAWNMCWALGARSRVLRGNIPGYRLPDCGYVGPDEDVRFFEGGVYHTRADLEFGP